MMLHDLSYQANAVLSEYGKYLEHKNLKQGSDKYLWEWELAKNLSCLSQGVGSRITN